MADEFSSSSANFVVLTIGNTLSSQPNTLISINVATQMPFKLSKMNYASWRAQFTNLLFGYDLLGFLDDTTPCPLETILQFGSTTSISNPECKLWKQQDRLILYVILASITWVVAPLISSATTSHEAWQKLEITFANRLRTRMLSLRNIMMKTTKGSQSITEYMQTIKIITNDLAFMGYPLSEDEIILHVFNGLDNDFKEISAAIRARDSPVTFEELHDKLQDQETLLKQDDTSKEAPPITAQFHHKFSNHKGNSEKSGGHPGGNFNNKGSTNNFGNRNIFDNQGKNIVQGNKNLSNQGNHHPQQHFNSSQYSWCPNNGTNQRRIICQLCDKAGHSAKVCHSRPPSRFSP